MADRPTEDAALPVLGHTLRRPRRIAALLAAVLLVIAAVVLFTDLGGPSLHGDEAIYAAVALHSAEVGAWFPLETWYGTPFTVKPPLKILGEAVLFRTLGPSEWTARVLDATAGLLTVALVYLVGARLTGPWTGLLAGLVLLAAHGWVLEHGARAGVCDAGVTLLGLVALLGWMRMRWKREGRARAPLVTVVAVVAAGLVKTAHGLLFAAVIVVLAIVVRRRGERLRQVLPAALVVLAAAAAAELALLLVMQALTGGLAVPSLLHETVQRAVTGVDPHHLHGALFYPRVLWRDFGAWLLLVPFAFPRLGLSTPDLAVPHLAAWTGVLAIIATLSVSKLPWYLYLFYPALALLVAVGAGTLVRMIRSDRLRSALAVGVGAAVLASVATTWLEIRSPGPRLTSHIVAAALEARPAVAVRVRATALDSHLAVWDWWYVQRISRWAERAGSGKHGQAGREVVLTSSPALLLADERAGWHPVAWIPAHDASGQGLWALANFVLELPGVPEPRPIDLSSLILADGFEAGAVAGWAPANAAAPGPVAAREAAP